MKIGNDLKDVLRVVGVVLVGLFVLVVGVPLVFSAAAGTLSVIGFVLWLVFKLVKIAVVLAVVYLVLVGIRALLK